MEESSESSCKGKYFCIIRHGERLDYVDGEEKKDIVEISDPGLSKEGHRQARVGGEYISEFCASKGAKRVKILASPCVRTTQTAVQIAKAIGTLSVTLDNRFVEWMKKPWFLKPLDEIEINALGIDNFKLKYLSEEDQEVTVAYLDNHTEELKEKYPEKMNSATNRYKDAIDEVLESAEMADNDMVIVVTHLFGLECFSEKFHGESANKDYCATSIVEKEEEEWRLLVDCESHWMGKEKKIN
ncbi:unnamed protein product [Moneuplotes crassus]|uniref:Uncharacterized protein n=1 Tax=Euplotes crassus TaxID=5936 RepID=A0AAD2D3F7_EUPCR|nr:unnamed protein product [Moneuplotes crassus]